MPKATQRFSWQRNANKGMAIKVDSATNTALEIDGTKFPTEIAAEIFVYGISKIVDDRLSQIAPDLKMSQAKKLVTQFMDGKWKAEREAGARFLPPIIEVIMEFKGWTVSKAQASYRALSEDARQELKESQAERIAEIVEARKADVVSSLDDMI